MSQPRPLNSDPVMLPTTMLFTAAACQEGYRILLGLAGRYYPLLSFHVFSLCLSILLVTATIVTMRQNNRSGFFAVTISLCAVKMITDVLYL
jgi:hypothetical protein